MSVSGYFGQPSGAANPGNWSYVSSQGTALTKPPTSWASGTDWSSASSPALPPSIRAIWIDITPGLTCSIKLDGGGQTGLVFNNVQSGWWPLPPGIAITKLYAPANGSKSAAIDAVLS